MLRIDNSKMPVQSIDLATELGESFFFPPCGLGIDVLKTIKAPDGQELHPRHTAPRHDDVLVDIISTGYVACSGHSGDAVIMAETMRTLVSKGKTVGAHPSYPDIFGFAQVAPIGLGSENLMSVLVAQLASACALATIAGTQIRSVKCHGRALL